MHLPLRDGEGRCRRFAAAWGVAAFAALLFAGVDQCSGQSEKARRNDPEVEAAFAMAPELGADLLILIAKGSSRSRAERVEILERAFEMAAGAKHPLRRVGATNAAAGTDSDAGALTSALQPGLDRLSLRSRVVEELVPLDKSLAKKLFDVSRPVRIDALGCEDALGYSFEAFYQSAIVVIQHGYSTKEAVAGEPARFAEGLLRQVGSAFQLEGALRILLLDLWRGEELSSLATAFSSMLAHLQVDDRSFAANTSFSNLQMLVRLDERLRSNEIDSFPLVQAYRGYLVRHLKAPRCADQIDSPVMSRFIELFNQSLVAKQANLGAITAEDLKARKVVEEEVRVYEFWTAPESEWLLNGLRELRFGSREQAEARKKLGLTRPDRLAPYLTEAERSTVGWRVALEAFVKAFHEWESRSEEPPLARFHEKCSILRGLIALVPQAEHKQALMRELLAYLAAAEMRVIDPAVWKHQLELSVEMPELSEKERTEFTAIAKQSGDVYINARAVRGKRR